MKNTVKKSCLLVDDSRVVRKVARRIAEDLGFACAEAENGKEALEACRESMPDVVLLDWNMPVMGGIEFTKELRRLENGKHPKIVFCTTENDAHSIRLALDSGADEYIMKPFDREIVESKFFLTGLMEKAP